MSKHTRRKAIKRHKDITKRRAGHTERVTQKYIAANRQTRKMREQS